MDVSEAALTVIQLNLPGKFKVKRMSLSKRYVYHYTQY
jgi:hypothetical protein